MLKIARLVVNPFEENTYIIIDTDTLEAAVVDPGMVTVGENNTFADYVDRNKLNITQVLFTHGHLDHCFGASFVRNRYGAVVKGHAEDKPLLESVPDQARRFGMQAKVSGAVVLDVEIKDGDKIKIGNSAVDVIAVPGHSRGGVSFYDKDGKWVITGDSLFKGAIGRTDLPGGDYATLVNAVRKQLLSLPEDTTVYPGHGPATTIGEEKVSNPYV